MADPRGTYYFPFLKYINVLKWVLSFLLYPTEWMMELSGYDAYIVFFPDLFKDGGAIGIIPGWQLRVAFPCMGFKIMISFLALMFAYRGTKKWIYIPLGLLFIQVINLLRVWGIVAALINNKWGMTTREMVNISHDFFNYSSYICIFLFFLFWIRKK
ncbi:exosortase/archaeosortase family protein [Cytophaga hutchinsonii]|uniref:Exosortase/archaeosortase family protein n=1 Tax=Cytophaga hutchinsonii (strain ATCC 33406 / DSM 1761 / CIP 103989 / NBRC 15051 / NCIMB 9469 / D465) TaxID=269798 RepID=A0A6N4SPD4_CYTH3|nr:exosortase/archaeosortase family protein [Cytophaga hutchinsonii]ABG58157.1 hypothetical protein CHU_0874 [Cytophaga hutchinsonii ATCC 33406]